MTSSETFLKRLKLVDNLTTELPIERKDFVERLRRNVDEGDTSILFSSFEIFSSSKNEYKGTVNYDSFKIRRRKKMFDFMINLAVAEGTFRQRGEHLVIESTIRGFNILFIPYTGLILLFYLVFVIAFLTSDNLNTMSWLFVPFLLLHAGIMLGVPYMIMRRGVSRLKYELEREFYFITNKCQ